MIKLNDYFSPVPKPLASKHKAQKDFLGSEINFISNTKELSKVQLVIFTVGETRNSIYNQDSPSFESFRQYLYGMQGFKPLAIGDLGELKLGKKVKDTYLSLQKVVAFFLEQNILPVIVGGSQDLTLAISKAFLECQTHIEQIIIDAKADIGTDGDIHSGAFIQEITTQKKASIGSALLGFQSYFVGNNQMTALNKAEVELFRLGQVRGNYTGVEPILRDADFASIDLSSVRHSDCPAVSFKSPNGLYAEEICQLSNIIGQSDKVQALGMFEYQSLEDQNGQTAHLLAQITWHFLLGQQNKMGDYPKGSLSNYKKIYVKLDRLDFDLVFYKNEINKRFWVEIPNKNPLEKDVISCSELDYLQITNDEIPDRIWKKIAKSMPSN